MASDQMMVKVRIRGLWRARLALSLCGAVLWVAPRPLRAPLCRAILWLSWFSIDLRMAGRSYRNPARLTLNTDREAR